MRRLGPPNASKVHRTAHVIESDSDDDNEIAVRGDRTNLFSKELDQVLQPKATQPVAGTTKAPKPRPVETVDLTAPKFFPPTKPTPQQTSDPVVIEDDGEGEESVDVDVGVDAKDEYEYSGKSATQIEGDVKELFKGTVVNHEVEIEEGDDIVEKFADDFRLLRHQIQAREWMKGRESGSSRGGILADDMGSVLLVIVLT